MLTGGNASAEKQKGLFLVIMVTCIDSVGENAAVIDNPLHEAAKRGNSSFAKELIDAGVSVNGLDKAKNSPLSWACRGGHLDIVQMLLAKKAAVNSQVYVIDLE